MVVGNLQRCLRILAEFIETIPLLEDRKSRLGANFPNKVTSITY